MSLDLDFIRKLILVSKNDLFQINKELKDLKIIIKEELKELKELKKTVVKKKSKGYIETIVKIESKSYIEDKIEKNHYGNIILEEDDNEKDFCDVSLTCNEEKNRPFKCVLNVLNNSC